MEGSMTDIVVDEPVYFYQWETDHHVAYDAIVRVIPGGGHAVHRKLHLTVYFEDAPSGFFNVNNINNIEQHGDFSNLDGEDYWRKRYAIWPLS